MNTPDSRLACGCWQRIRMDMAKVNAYAYCRFHGTTHIEVVKLYEWRTRCQHDGCRYGGWHGQSETVAKASRNRHQRKWPQHPVALAYDRITWDGAGSLLRDELGRAVKRDPDSTTPSAKQPVFRLDIPPPF